MTGTISSTIAALKIRYGIIISEGENFKQAWYNSRLTDTDEQFKDKIELAVKHRAIASKLINF